MPKTLVTFVFLSKKLNKLLTFSALVYGVDVYSSCEHLILSSCMKNTHIWLNYSFESNGIVYSARDYNVYAEMKKIKKDRAIHGSKLDAHERKIKDEVNIFGSCII